jgi:L-tryptophan--pyruvate aminotransferase
MAMLFNIFSLKNLLVLSLALNLSLVLRVLYEKDFEVNNGRSVDTQKDALTTTDRVLSEARATQRARPSMPSSSSTVDSDGGDTIINLDQ